MATYHSGNITSDETWAKADNPHIVNGNLTLDDGIHLTIEPGVNVEVSGYYSIRWRGKITFDGTKAEPINFYSNVAYPKTNSYNYVYFGDDTGTSALDADSTMSWCIWQHSYGPYLNYWAGFDTDNSIHHIVIDNCRTWVIREHATSPLTIKNIFLRNMLNMTYAYISSGNTLTIEDVHCIDGGAQSSGIRVIAVAGASGTFEVKRFLIEQCYYWYRGTNNTGTILLEDGFISKCGQANFYRTNVTVQRCSFYENIGNYPIESNSASLELDSNHNDFKCGRYYALYGGSATTFTSDNDYIEGHNFASRDTVDDTETTGGAAYMYTGLTSARTNAQVAPNRPLENQMPYTVSGVTANEATIGVDTDVKCSSMIEYYDTENPDDRMRTNIKYNDWSETNYVEDSDGNQQTTSHSHNLYNLKPGTTYEYFIVMIAPWGEIKDGVVGASFTTDAAGGAGWYPGD